MIRVELYLRTRSGSRNLAPLNEFIDGRVPQLQTYITTLNTNPSSYGDGEFIADLQTDLNWVKTYLTQMYDAAIVNNEDYRITAHANLIAICTGFNQHLGSLREFYRSYTIKPAAAN